MPNAVPSTFDYRDGCGWFKKSDNSGPYAINSNGKAVLLGGGADYETVAASQTGQVLGATGAVGDYIATSIVVLPNNVGAGVGTYTIPLGLQSVSGAWSITTAAGVAVVAVGNFT
jgi:hypothetical protein